MFVILRRVFVGFSPKNVVLTFTSKNTNNKKKVKHPEQILLMVAVMVYILHFEKLGRILFSVKEVQIPFYNRD